MTNQLNAAPAPLVRRPIRTVIADDELLARRKMKRLFRSECDIQVVAECTTGRETTAAVTTLRPDLLFLDIKMPDGDGFDVLRSIAVEAMPLVIFTTAYDNYAVNAFEMHAFDYLLKPFDHDRLRGAIQRARLELSKSTNGEFIQRIMALLATNKGASAAAEDRFVVKSSGRVVFLDAAGVDWIEAAANYVRFHVGRESHLMRENISTVAGKLDPNRFARIHRSTIVNVSRIKEVHSCNSGEYMVVLRDGRELSCSRGYRSAIQQLVDAALC
jgi:two-component system LytT family response regulator